MPTNPGGGATEASTTGADATGADASTTGAGLVDGAEGPVTEQHQAESADPAAVMAKYGVPRTRAEDAELGEVRKMAAGKLRADGYRILRSGVVEGKNVIEVEKDGERKRATIGPRGGIDFD